MRGFSILLSRQSKIKLENFMAEEMLDAVRVIHKALGSLNPDERRRVISSAMALFGDAAVRADIPREDVAQGSAGDDNVPNSVKIWMKQNSITAEDIGRVFHKIDDAYSVIVSIIPGKNNREKVINAYLLEGVSKFLEKGEAVFEDKSARSVCERFGFYDSTNHSKYMKGHSEFVKIKDRGWIITAPGLKSAARLVSNSD